MKQELTLIRVMPSGILVSWGPASKIDAVVHSGPWTGYDGDLHLFIADVHLTTDGLD